MEGDILEHMRQYGKAQVKYTEAGNHLAVMRDMENHQSGRVTKIVPQVASHWSGGDFE